jgi:predicted nuclease with TOPRIM domain|tara:strand:- start:1853 stop:2443 length:591 start_codon:yes stop_codon:yes gene_type:complete
MTKTIKDIVAKLPDGFSESGMEEISEVLEGVVTERVNEEMQQLTAKVSGFLRLKLDEMKATAREELYQEDATCKAVKVYEAIKTIVAEDIISEDDDSVVSTYKNENEELLETVDSLNSNINKLMNENSLLEDAFSKLRDDYSVLSETEKKPFKSSEQALIITNEEKNANSLPQEAVDNSFLTEEVIKLATSNNPLF